MRRVAGRGSCNDGDNDDDDDRGGDGDDDDAFGLVYYKHSYLDRFYLVPIGG